MYCQLALPATHITTSSNLQGTQALLLLQLQQVALL
jgi:hypothetical protein